MFAKNYGHLVPCDLPSSGEVYKRYAPAIAMDQVYLDCSLSVLQWDFNI